MMENSANTSYTFGMATGEILILLLLAFLAGMLLCWLLRKMGICCTRKRDIPSTGVPVNTLTTETMGNYQVSPSAFDRRVGNLTATGANVAEKAERMPVRESVKVDPIKTPEPPTIKVEHDIIKPVIVPPVVPITEVDVQPSPKEIPLKDISLPETPTLDLTANKPTVVDVNTIEPISHSTKGLDAEAELPQFPSDLEFPEHTVKASAPPEITVEEVQDPVEAESKSFFDSLLATHLRSLSGQEPSPTVHLEKPDLTPSASVQPLSVPELPTAKTTHLPDIDPHRPIIDGPDDVVVAGEGNDWTDKAKIAVAGTAAAAAAVIGSTIDPHKPIIDDPEDEGFFSAALKKIQDTAEKVSDKVETWVEGAKENDTPIADTLEEQTDNATAKAEDTANAVAATAQDVKEAVADKAIALGDKAEAVADEAADKLSDAKAATQDTVDELVEDAQSTGNKLAEKASDTLDAAKDKLQDAKEAVTDTAHETSDKLAATVEDIDPHRPIVDESDEDKPGFFGSLLHKVQDAAERVSDKVEGWVDNTQSASDDVVDQAKEAAATTDAALDQPVEKTTSTTATVLGTAAAAAASAVALGSIDPHRPIEDDPEEEKPGFFNQALHQLQDAAGHVSDKVEGWVDTAKEKAANLTEPSADTSLAADAQAAGDKLADESQDLKEAVADKAADVADDVQSAGEKLADKAQDLKEAVADKAADVADDVQSAGEKLADKAQDVKEAVADKAADVVDDVQSAGEKLADKAQDLKEAVADKTADVADDVQSAGEKLADKAQDLKESVADKAAEVVDDVQSAGDKLADKAQDLKEAVADKTADVADEVKVAGEAVADTAETTVDTVKDHAQDTQDAISESTKALTAEVATDTPVTTLDGIDPHRPIVEDPEEETGFFGSLFTKLHDAAERVSDKVGGLVNDVAEKTDDATDKAEKADQEASAENSSVLGTTAAILGTTAAISATALSAGTQSSSTEDHADSQQPSATIETAPESAPSSSPDPALVSVTHYKPAKTAEELNAPEALADQTHEMAETVTDKARDLVTEAKDSGETITEQTSHVVDDAKDAIAAKASDLSDTVETAATDLTATASDAADTLQESTQKASDTVAEKTQDLADQAKEAGSAIADKASDVIESIQDKTQQAKDTVADKAAELSDNVKALGESVADKTDATLDAVKAKVEDVQEAVADKTSDTVATVNELTADKPQGSATADYDPHKPIVDEPEDELALSTSLDSGLLTQEPTTSLDYDPHKPIEDESENAPQPTSNGGFFSGLLHNAVEGVSHLGEKVDQLLGDKAPAAHDLLQKAKDQVEHLGAKVDHLSEKATPVAQDWVHKAKDTVDHLVEKAPPSAQELVHKAKDTVEHLGEKAAPVAKSWLQRAVEKVGQLSENAPASTQEWLHKAKDTLETLGEKLDQHTPDASTTTTETKAPESTPTSTSPLQAESLVKSSATLNELATSTQELTEKLMHNMSAGQSDFQRIYGIDATIAQALQVDGIVSYRQLADALPKRIHSLLEQLGGQYVGCNISSWFVQANLAAQDEWNILEAYQRELKKNDNAV